MAWVCILWRQGISASVARDSPFQRVHLRALAGLFLTAIDTLDDAGHGARDIFGHEGVVRADDVLFWVARRAAFDKALSSLPAGLVGGRHCVDWVERICATLSFYLFLLVVDISDVHSQVVVFSGLEGLAFLLEGLFFDELSTALHFQNETLLCPSAFDILG